MFWTADTGIDGQTPVDLDDLDLVPIGPLPSWVWYQDMAEHLIEKYCALLGTTVAAVVAHEDRVALQHLRSRTDTTGRAASIGLSGGGCRSALLRATTGDELTAAAVVGMMGSYDSLLDHNVIDHTWMLLPAGLAARADWPDLAACQAPAALLVQYNRHDELFPSPGRKPPTTASPPTTQTPAPQTPTPAGSTTGPTSSTKPCNATHSPG